MQCSPSPAEAACSCRLPLDLCCGSLPLTILWLTIFRPLRRGSCRAMTCGQRCHLQQQQQSHRQFVHGPLLGALQRACTYICQINHYIIRHATSPGLIDQKIVASPFRGFTAKPCSRSSNSSNGRRVRVAGSDAWQRHDDKCRLYWCKGCLCHADIFTSTGQALGQCSGAQLPHMSGIRVVRYTSPNCSCITSIQIQMHLRRSSTTRQAEAAVPLLRPLCGFTQCI
jgi:hypothetical protein